MLNTVGVIAVAALMAPTFGVYAAIIANLSVEIAGLLQMQLNFGINPPTLALNLIVVVELIAALQLALDIAFPNIQVSFLAAFNLELAFLLGIVAALEAAISAGAVAGIEVFTYAGPGSALGAGVALGPNTVTTLIIGATSAPAISVIAQMFNGVVFQPGVTVWGELTLSAILETTFALLLDLFGEFSARAKAMAKITGSISVTPPSVAASIVLCVKIAEAIQAAINVGIPSVTANLLASIQARIQVIASLVAQINVALSWGTQGFDVFTYTGVGSGLGPALTTALAGGWPDGAGPSEESNVLILAATTPAAAAALGAFFPPVAA